MQSSQGGPGIEHVYPSDIRASGRCRISDLTHHSDLGLGTVGSAAQIADGAFDALVDGVHPCHSLGGACRFRYCVCASDSRLSLLRSSSSADISLRSIAFPGRHRVWGCWCVAAEFVALARARFRVLHAGVLDHGGRGGMKPGRACSFPPPTSRPTICRRCRP